MEEQKLRQLFKNRANCYADSEYVIQAMDEDCFIETIKEALSQHDVIKNEVAVCVHDKVEVEDDGLGNTHYCSKCREWNF
ncbi:MAG: hypothetical protein ACK5B9_05395 [Flavobacteriia bacterium]|jgi:hypothetical protein